MKRIVTALALAVSSCATAPVMASANCPTFAEIEDILVDQAGERPLIASASHQGTAFMFWTNESTGSWTLTETIGECTYVREYGIGLVVPSYGEPV